MITEQQLRDIFQYAFMSDIDEVVYRKNTSDTIPQYRLRVSNRSDVVHIKAYLLAPDYINVTEAKNGFPLTDSEGVVLPPQTSADLIITIDPAGIDDSTDESPRISFELRALEPSTTNETVDTPTDVPTGDEDEAPAPSPTTGTGIDTGTTDRLVPTRRKRETEVDDFVGPIAQQ